MAARLPTPLPCRAIREAPQSMDPLTTDSVDWVKIPHPCSGAAGRSPCTRKMPPPKCPLEAPEEAGYTPICPMRGGMVWAADDATPSRGAKGVGEGARQ